MRKVIEDIDEKKGIKRVTTVDERWYVRPSEDPNTGLPGHEYVPSVTWISGKYPKGIYFYKWLADKGWDEAEAIKSAAGDKGSKVHYAITYLLTGEPITFESVFPNPGTGKAETLTIEEWECLMSFQAWYLETKPEIIANEVLAWNEEHGYAGTIDLICKINGQLYIVDFKTGQNIWPEYELQLSAYNAAMEDNHKLAILQIGYRRNKNGWKFTEVQDKFDLFLAAKQIWANEHTGEKPSQKDYPLTLSLVTKEDKPKQSSAKVKRAA